MTPNQAKKEGNRLMVSCNLWNSATKNRQYLELKVGDEVREIQKKDNKTKGHMPKWSMENDYMVNDGKRKLHQRHELLKV